MLVAIMTSLNERRREMAILRSVGARPMHVLSLIVGEAGLVTLMGITAGIGLLEGLLLLGQPLMADRLGLWIGITGFTVHEMLLMGIVLVAGVVTGIIPGVRIYRHSLVDGLTVRV
jgi:putative ABC transport system permease protein